MTLHLSGALTQTGYRCISRCSYSSSSAIHLRSNDSTDPTRTVFIPRSKFPPNHDPKTELSIQEDTKFARAYLEQDPSRKLFVIHDGPPFANGQIHLGHAINKILKDIAARHAMITGHRVEFITGWDCHGLPIEMQVLKIAEEQQRQSNYGGSLLENAISPEHFRAKARTYAKSQIDLQMASFKRMGLLTDWNKRYTTDDPSYVANQLRAFSHLYEQKLIFKDLMPVNWSTINKTTVADADIEYRPQHISKSAYVLYEIIDPPFTTDVPGQPLYSLVWTTTPWTLLENAAIAFNSQETYCLLRAWKAEPEDTKNMIVSLDSITKIQPLLQRLGYQSEVRTYVSGKSMIGLSYKPLLDSLLPDNEDQQGKPRPFLDAEFVDGAKGTGLVHLSPQYGFDDFALLKKKGIPIKRSLVDPEGIFCDDAGLDLAGKSIFSDGNQEVLNLMDQHKALLFTEYTQHKYPYEIRTNHPVMIRVSQQIFMDTSRIVPRCLKALESASFFPEGRGRQFINILSARPNWCISRQRLWGTPIPVLYDANDIDREKMITHPLIIEHFCRLLYKRRFMDYWWTTDNQELVPQELLDKCKLPYKSENLVRGNDIFDVWSDSGLSWHTTTNSLDDNQSQADIYLEGVDQLRGWFSSSCILSMALRGCLPTKRFITHGFALHKDGTKMSKSQGNVVDPIQLFEKYGVDSVRLWAAKSAGACQDVCVRQSEFESSIKMAINKVRLTLKYLIGALADNPTLVGKLDHTKLEPFDQYYLDKLYRFASTVDEHFKGYRYDMAAIEINSFITKALSPIYIHTIKDLLYCDELDSQRRKSCLTVLNVAYNMLLRCLYPITPHIVHEASQYLPPAEPLNEWQDLGYKASWKNDVLHDQFETIVKLQGVVAKILEKKFNTMQDHDSFLSISDKKLFKHLVKTTNANSNLLAELFRSSNFILSHDERLKAPDGVIEINREFDNESDELQDNEKKGEAEVINVKLLTSWTNELAQDCRFGGSLSINNGNPIRFEMCYKKSSNTKCSRCRRYAVLKVDEQANLCDRCRGALLKLEMLD